MGSGRGGRFRAVAPVVAAVMLGTAWQARPEPVRAVVPQTPPTPPTTRDLLKDLLNQLLPTTTVPAPAPAPAPDPASPLAPGSPPPPPAPGAPPLDSDGPPVLFAVPDFRPRAGIRSNAPLVDALRQLEELGFTEEEAMVIGMGHFPIAGPAYYTDGYLEPRPGHLHQGVDITATMGTPIRAPADGVVSYSEEGGYGKVAAVNVGGTSYFMAHLDGFAEGLSSGSRVKQGQIVGFVGSTGNSTGPHVHLEVRPGGAGTVDPKPILDKWLDEALAAIPVIVASFKGLEASLPRALAATGVLRRFDERPAGSAAALDALAWASTVSPGGAAVVPLAQQRVQQVASVEQPDPAVVTHASADSWRRAERLARAVMSPLTPAALEQLFGGGGD